MSFMERDAEDIGRRAYKFYRQVAKMLPPSGIYDGNDAVQDLARTALEQDLNAKVDDRQGNRDSLYYGVLRNKVRDGRRKFLSRRAGPLPEQLTDGKRNAQESRICEETQMAIRKAVRDAVRTLPPHFRRAIYQKFGPMGDDPLPPQVGALGRSTPSTHRNRAMKRLQILLVPVLQILID